jgi:hypothetical protein
MYKDAVKSCDVQVHKHITTHAYMYKDIFSRPSVVLWVGLCDYIINSTLQVYMDNAYGSPRIVSTLWLTEWYPGIILAGTCTEASRLMRNSHCVVLSFIFLGIRHMAYWILQHKETLNLLHKFPSGIGPAVALLVEALCYKPEGHGSIPDEVTGVFQFS